MTRNLINSECETHKKICQYLCSYSKCAKNLICQVCRRQHLSIHPAQFIYELQNLTEIHSFNKIDKLKEMLIKQKLAQETIIRQIYKPFQKLMEPLNKKVHDFAKQSRTLIQKQLASYLRSNKNIIDQTQKRIVKSQTVKIKNDPNKMLQQTINQAQIINKRQARIIQNGQGYKWYSDTTKQMCFNIVSEVTSMISVAIKIIDNSMNLQNNKYISDGLQLSNPHQMSFMKRYHASHHVAYQKNVLQAQVLKAKNVLNWKDKQIGKTKKEIKEKVIKIQQLQQKVEGLSEQLLQWEQKLQKQERQKRLAIQKQRKKRQEILIKNGIIGSNGKSISLQRKIISQDQLPLILEIVTNPICLDLSNNNLQKRQLQIFLKCSSLQILKFNFTKVDVQFLIKLFKAYPNLVQLQLNSAQIDDNILNDISKYFPPKIKILYLIDNKITDQGLQSMFMNMNITNITQKMQTLDQLYVSYNKLTQRSVQIINKYSYQIKILHIAKNALKSKGGQNIGKYLKQIQELFIGSTGITKDGFLAICRQCLKLKKLSLVANNQISTEVVTQILLGLNELKWLDISYCSLNKNDMQKIQKLKIFNKDLQIITSGDRSQTR